MLYDLIADPHEQKNLCADASFANVAEEMQNAILSRWDPITLKQDIIASQRRRHFIQDRFRDGKAAPWDFQPIFDASAQYLRSGNSPTAIKGLARFPQVEPRPPDTPRQI